MERARNALMVLMFVTFLVPRAHASLLFTFSFDNATGNTAGPITGEIHGLVDNAANQQATKVVITEIGSHPYFGHSLPFDVIGGGWTINQNDFTVSAGVITDWFFASFHDHLAGLIGTEQLGFGNSLDSASTPAFRVTPNSTTLLCNSVVGCSTVADSRDITFVSVPAPHILLLFALGLVVMGVTRRLNGTVTLG